MNKITDFILDFAKAFDSLRVIPRIVLFIYGILVYNLYTWYKSIPTVEELSCDSSILQTLIDSGVDPVVAVELSCTVIGLVGGPTTAQTSFVTIIAGLSTAVIGLYLNSGPKWNFTKSQNDFYYSDGPPGNYQRRPRRQWFGANDEDHNGE